MYMVDEDEGQNEDYILRRIAKRSSSSKRLEKLDILGEDYHTYIEKYHGFFTLTCQSLTQQFQNIFPSQQAIEQFFHRGITKHNNH